MTKEVSCYPIMNSALNNHANTALNVDQPSPQEATSFVKRKIGGGKKAGSDTGQKNKKKNNPKDAAPVEMAFDDGDSTAPPDRSLMNQSAMGSTISTTSHDSLNTSRSSSRNQPIIYQTMTAVYGGEKFPFSTPPDIKDEPAILKRFEEIEKKIQENQVNNHKHKCHQHQPTEVHSVVVPKEV